MNLGYNSVNSFRFFLLFIARPECITKQGTKRSCVKFIIEKMYQKLSYAIIR